MPLVTVNPTSNSSPDAGQGGLAVTGASNLGHSSTTSSAVGATSVLKTCKWTGFVRPAGQISAVTLKVGWNRTGALSDGGIDTSNEFAIDYSLNGGSSWTNLRDDVNVTSSSNGTDSVILSASQVISQVQVRDSLHATSNAGNSASSTATVSAIRLEIQVSSAHLIAII